MPAVCFYFQVHQPFRIRRFRFHEIRKTDRFFDDDKNRLIMRKVADKCYLPTNAKLLELIERFQGQFKVSFSISGVALEQMKLYYPEVLESFQRLAKTGCVEFLAETYYHSLSAVYDPVEFKAQVEQQVALVRKYFNQEPVTFRNTELIYSDEIGELIANLGFKTVLAEGADDIMAWRSPNWVYHHPRRQDLKILTKNYKLSDDIAFRFSNRGWPEYPLTAPKFADWVHRISGAGDVLNLFMDYETFGEHQWADTGIFEFLDHLPAEILKKPDWSFKTPREVTESYPSRGELSYWRQVSWADLERDLSAWIGNEMQQKALREFFGIKHRVLQRNNPALTETWRKLTTSDHFYYMCTKWFSDGDVHAYFSPFKSPYEAFVSAMNVLHSLDTTLLLPTNNTKGVA
jgi:alpha-amylase